MQSLRTTPEYQVLPRLRTHATRFSSNHTVQAVRLLLSLDGLIHRLSLCTVSLQSFACHRRRLELPSHHRLHLACGVRGGKVGKQLERKEEPTQERRSLSKAQRVPLKEVGGQGWQRVWIGAALPWELTGTGTCGASCGASPPATTNLFKLLVPAQATGADDWLELQPGLVILRGLVIASAQQLIANEVFGMGGGMSSQGQAGPLRSGGFYRASPGGWRELNVEHERRGSFVRLLADCHPVLTDLCQQCFVVASQLSSALPPLDAKACAFNFYEDDSPGLRWHRDIDETVDMLRGGQGRPVVSVSLGDDCDFEYRVADGHGQSQLLRLHSGDVLIFGGPSRGILHAVTKIHPRTRPRSLEMPPGRLNLTYRHYV